MTSLTVLSVCGRYRAVVVPQGDHGITVTYARLVNPLGTHPYPTADNRQWRPLRTVTMRVPLHVALDQAQTIVNHLAQSKE